MPILIWLPSRVLSVKYNLKSRLHLILLGAIWITGFLYSIAVKIISSSYKSIQLENFNYNGFLINVTGVCLFLSYRIMHAQNTFLNKDRMLFGSALAALFFFYCILGLLDNFGYGVYQAVFYFLILFGFTMESQYSKRINSRAT